MSTIGVSIAVPDPHGSLLQDYRVALGDESARLIPTHVTLLPPYEVADEDLPGIVEHLESIASESAPFTLHLRGTGTFRPISPVVFVVVVEGISQCEQLTARVRTGPLAADLRFPYHPHVTVAHDVEDALLDRAFADLGDYDCSFEAGAFHLYLHDEVTGWHTTRSFPLGSRVSVSA
ncbi:2'-5' RNA ligase family protein [Nocardioides terrisoli]|uniref:2'-5' RNA ligase family protein n=1 Tax=Nocardioides terrisoli TaxID=3388267 RepID=UPI00287BBE62|nr:2'-5' RNA ligase family protein [Nocardioides marmorisolisilvae]